MAKVQSLHRAVTGKGCPIEFHVIARYAPDDKDQQRPRTGYAIVRRREVYDLDPVTYERMDEEPRGIEWLWAEQSPYTYPTLAQAVHAANKMAADALRFWLRITALAEKQKAALTMKGIA